MVFKGLLKEVFELLRDDLIRTVSPSRHTPLD
jgi:hypothetical protein